ncbi:alpha/beta fold hydrolase [Sphingomonas radiodurans]|uniref:alpha/beta fold hydrolase n=1 Tax=Sphingomonas radiodurans TaxID=2890321 RepID=UPI001E3E2418|nr:alpha/beta fold hydrolase [Sphingomonas radiodurans]WBH16309.1 alpha/beta fold hydrolase [Sphingomonas radiodurans]
MGLIDRRSLLAGGAASLLAVPALGRTLDRPTRELMVPVEGGRIYVRVNGDLTSPRAPIVMVHGGPGGTHAGFLDALPLADERAVILYDQLDSGRSERPGDPANWRVARFVDELEAIRGALGIARWHVLGASWGGTVALEYGARRPAALKGLALASPLISTRSWLADAQVLIGDLPQPIRDELQRCGALTLLEPPPACDAPTRAFYAAFNRREPASAEVVAYAGDGGGSNARLYRAMWGASEFVSTGTLKDYDGEPLLAKLEGKRTLFLCGQYDEARPVTIGAFAARTPGAEFAVVPGAAHGLFNDRPVEARAIVRQWLARQDALA